MVKKFFTYIFLSFYLIVFTWNGSQLAQAQELTEDKIRERIILLNNRQQQIVSKYYGFDGKGKKDFDVIAKELNLSLEDVYDNYANALVKISEADLIPDRVDGFVRTALKYPDYFTDHQLEVLRAYIDPNPVEWKKILEKNPYNRGNLYLYLQKAEQITTLSREYKLLSRKELSELFIKHFDLLTEPMKETITAIFDFKTGSFKPLKEAALLRGVSAQEMGRSYRRALERVLLKEYGDFSKILTPIPSEQPLPPIQKIEPRIASISPRAEPISRSLIHDYRLENQGFRNLSKRRRGLIVLPLPQRRPPTTPVSTLSPSVALPVRYQVLSGTLKGVDAAFWATLPFQYDLFIAEKAIQADQNILKEESKLTRMIICYAWQAAAYNEDGSPKKALDPTTIEIRESLRFYYNPDDSYCKYGIDSLNELIDKQEKKLMSAINKAGQEKRSLLPDPQKPGSTLGDRIYLYFTKGLIY